MKHCMLRFIETLNFIYNFLNTFITALRHIFIWVVVEIWRVLENAMPFIIKVLFRHEVFFTEKSNPFYLGYLNSRVYKCLFIQEVDS